MNILASNETNQSITLSMSDSMHSQLDKFFAEKTIVDVDRNTYLNLNLHDGRYKIVVSLVFMRDFDGLEINSYSDVVLEGKGVVFILPPYWISIPKELAIPYFEYLINDFYTNTVSEWIQNGIIGNGGANSNNTSNNNGSCNQQPLCPCNML